tara:strand:+ start:3002 stop:3406 length:405 start_codon:yes stop_codon:yes gene_type:complete
MWVRFFLEERRSLLVHNMVAFHGLVFGFCARNYSISAAKEKNTSRGVVHSAPGPWENHGIITHFRGVTVGKLLNINFVAKMRTTNNILDSKAVACGAPRFGKPGYHQCKAVMRQKSFTDGFSAGDHLFFKKSQN